MQNGLWFHWLQPALGNFCKTVSMWNVRQDEKVSLTVVSCHLHVKYLLMLPVNNVNYKKKSVYGVSICQYMSLLFWERIKSLHWIWHLSHLKLFSSTHLKAKTIMEAHHTNAITCPKHTKNVSLNIGYEAYRPQRKSILNNQKIIYIKENISIVNSRWIR